MTCRFGAAPLLACIAFSAACEGGRGVGPDQVTDFGRPSAAPRPAPVLTTLSLGPSTFTLALGTSVRLTVTARDQWGARIHVGGGVAFASDAPTIAMVSEGGVVTGLAPGTAVISAAVPAGDSIRRATITIVVADAVVRDSVVLTFGDRGWQPSRAYVAVGGLVRWSTSGSGHSFDTPAILLLDQNYTVLETLALTDGSVTRRFDTAGIVRYCSNPCWDGTDFGEIHVR